MIVDHNATALAHLQTAGPGQGILGADAGGEHDQVGFQHFFILEDHAVLVVLAVLDTLSGPARQYLNPQLLDLFAQQIADLRALDLKLGGTRDLRLLSRIGRLEYLELYMVRGLDDLEPIALMISLSLALIPALITGVDGSTDAAASVMRAKCNPVTAPAGAIDIVGAGDAVTANLAAALAAGVTLPEALELANTAASIVIHKLGTTGTASVEELRSW